MSRSGDDTLGVCYHAVSDQWPASLAVRPAQLVSQMRHLTAKGYRGVTVQDAIGAGSGRRVAVTFDDGCRSVFEAGFPLLRSLGLVGTVFVVTSFVGLDGPMSWPGVDDWLGGPHERELWPLTWAQLRTLADAGWEVGAHTVSHPHLTQLGDTELRYQLEHSREVCEQQLQRSCPTLAYPYGDHDGRVVDAARAAGFTAAVTLPEGFASPDPLRWPRVGVYRDDGRARFRAKVSPSVRQLRGSRGWPVAARSLRAAAGVGPALRRISRRGDLRDRR